MDLNLLNYAPRNGIENGEGVGLLTLITMVKPGHLEEIVTLEDGGDLRQEILHCKIFMEVTDLRDNGGLCIGPSFLDWGHRRKRRKDYCDFDTLVVVVQAMAPAPAGGMRYIIYASFLGPKLALTSIIHIFILLIRIIVRHSGKVDWTISRA